jgi:hypothetical protein
LRIDATAGGAELVVPNGVSDADAERFARRHQRWVAEKLADLPTRRRFEDGMILPVLGQDLRVHHDASAPRAARHDLEAGSVTVGGRADQLGARLEAWLRETARGALLDATTRHAGSVGQQFSAIRIGDPRTRWGSCSRRGVLSYSWRLVLAPPWVLDYVAAHEAAHLVEMNHGPSFWRLVESLVTDSDSARAWLSEHGPGLHRYG